MTYDIGNLSPCLGHAQQCIRVALPIKHINTHIYIYIYIYIITSPP